MTAYQHGGVHDVYNVLPSVGARLRHDDATSGEHGVNFIHPFSITNITSARQGQQQLLRTTEFDDVKSWVFQTGEPPANDVTNYYHHPRFLQSPCAGHLTDRKSATATPCLNGGDGHDASQCEMVSTTTNDERRRSSDVSTRNDDVTVV